ncbi:hypothetical protein [Burkholderia cepacia]|uniref:hypothetical protein n=1 Tax=Burkholderia cepacia TaxID=292 RepID=UPI000ABB03C8|nr:hypothetical protein [Burkholderia cepacia]
MSFQVPFERRANDFLKKIEAERKRAASVILDEIRRCVLEFDFKPEDFFSDEELQRARAEISQHFEPDSGST